jgi:hypothetical protein
MERRQSAVYNTGPYGLGGEVAYTRKIKSPAKTGKLKLSVARKAVRKAAAKKAAKKGAKKSSARKSAGKS